MSGKISIPPMIGTVEKEATQPPKGMHFHEKPLHWVREPLPWKASSHHLKWNRNFSTENYDTHKKVFSLLLKKEHSCIHR